MHRDVTKRRLERIICKQHCNQPTTAKQINKDKTQYTNNQQITPPRKLVTKQLQNR